MIYFCNVYQTRHLGWHISQGHHSREEAERWAPITCSDNGWRRVFILRVREKRA